MFFFAANQLETSGEKNSTKTMKAGNLFAAKLDETFPILRRKKVFRNFFPIRAINFFIPLEAKQPKKLKRGKNVDPLKLPEKGGIRVGGIFLLAYDDKSRRVEIWSKCLQKYFCWWRVCVREKGRERVRERKCVCVCVSTSVGHREKDR